MEESGKMVSLKGRGASLVLSLMSEKKRHPAAAVRKTYAGLIIAAAIFSAIRKALLLLFGEGK